MRAPISEMYQMQSTAPRGASTSDITDATACADGRETPYRRAGHGDPVVLLAVPESPTAPPLFEALAQRHRVYSPKIPAQLAATESPRCRTTFAEWLRGFLDALGVTRASIVADEHAGAAAVGFALLEHYRIARVVLVLTAAAGDAPEPMSDALQHSRIPLLTAWYSPGDGEIALDEIQRFLCHPADV